MGLSAEEVKKRYETPSKSITISKAITHEGKLRYHTESFIDKSDLPSAHNDFLRHVKALLPEDKYKTFESLVTFPVPTVRVTGSIFTELERVFDGKNPVINLQFEDSELEQEAEDYRINTLNDPEVWRGKAWEVMKTAINSVMVVDMPREQQNDSPEPYFYFLDIANVRDYDFDGEKINFIVFNQDNNHVVSIDDESYMTFLINEKGDLVLESESKHDLGYCPANFYWTTSLNSKHPDLKKSPLSPQLGNFRRLLRKIISKDHLDLYGAFPIYSAYDVDCDFENGNTGAYCDGGFLRDDTGWLIDGFNEPTKCPKCKTNKLAGAGSFIGVPVPDDKNDVDMRDPVTITTVDRGSLDYNTEEVARGEKEIFAAVVGTGGDIEQKQSINESQVAANFESRVNVLNSIKGNLEKAMAFVYDTVFKLRYGSQYIGCSVSLGTEFYIYSVADLQKQYKEAKESGASESFLDAIDNQIIETEYRNDARTMQRMKILRALEPYRHYTRSEALTLFDKGLADESKLKVKIEFNSFIERFERENVNIIEFGINTTFDQKIKTITEKLISYGNENSSN